MTHQEKKYTNRGFRIYAEDLPCRHGKLKVQESSIAFEGAHIWLFYEERGKALADTPSAQINVATAKKLMEALSTFIVEAEADELTEPVEYTEPEDSEEME